MLEVALHRLDAGWRDLDPRASTVQGVTNTSEPALVFELTDPPERGRGRNSRRGSEAGYRDWLLSCVGYEQFEQYVPGRVREQFGREMVVSCTPRLDELTDPRRTGCSGGLRLGVRKDFGQAELQLLKRLFNLPNERAQILRQLMRSGPLRNVCKSVQQRLRARTTVGCSHSGQHWRRSGAWG